MKRPDPSNRLQPAPDPDDLPIYLFHKGENFEADRFFGAHPDTQEGVAGYVFRVWAPHARSIRVIGEFCDWQPDRAVWMSQTRQSNAVWHCFIPHLKQYDAYQYYIERPDGSLVHKSDPYGVHMETRSGTASKIYDLAGFAWTDGAYRSAVKRRKTFSRPMNIYEVHLGSWKTDEQGQPLSYQALADTLVPYVKQMGYTHIELMPLAEHPLDLSWGYQVTGYFAPTSRYGTPHDLMALVNRCHEEGIGVIMDWVAAHFCKNENGLYEFDGDCCYEYQDPRKREHPGWGTRIFDYGRNEVQCFLISNLLYWLREYHIDGIRVDAVASMLYLDYGKQHGEWSANQYGGHTNLEAIEFLKRANQKAFELHPQVLMIAEESTSFPMVTKPPEDGGLGFNYKWNMGWMNDQLRYMSTDPLFRKEVHHTLTFSMMYAFSENYILPLSHDEVVHEKCSMIEKMPGLYGQKFANLRAFYGYMMAHPGKKLTFMGNEFAQFVEWDVTKQLDWMLLDFPKHQELQRYVSDLNHFYLDATPLWQEDHHWKGFSWISCDDDQQSVLAFLRIDSKEKTLLVVCNFCPVLREGYRIGVPFAGTYTPALSSDDLRYGGDGIPLCSVVSEEIPLHGREHSIAITLPPMSTVYYSIKKKPQRKKTLPKPGSVVS